MANIADMIQFVEQLAILPAECQVPNDCFTMFATDDKFLNVQWACHTLHNLFLKQYDAMQTYLAEKKYSYSEIGLQEFLDSIQKSLAGAKKLINELPEPVDIKKLPPPPKSTTKFNLFESASFEEPIPMRSLRVKPSMHNV